MQLKFFLLHSNKVKRRIIFLELDFKTIFYLSHVHAGRKISHFSISAKNLSDLVNESLTLSEEATVAASADVSRLSSPPPSTAPQIMHSISSNVEDGSSPISSTGATGELVQGTNTGDNSMTSSELQVREFKGANFGLSNSRKILPGPPPERLVAITNNMNSHLTSLLVCIDFSLFCPHDQNVNSFNFCEHSNILLYFHFRLSSKNVKRNEKG